MPWKSLKSALLFNAFACVLIGALLIAGAAAVAALAGADAGAIAPWVCTLAGAALLLLAVDLAFVATRPVIPLTLARLLTAADAVFVVATPVVMVVAAPWLSNLGQLMLADLALLTAFCVWCQWRGLRREQAAPARAGA
ncbi:hypothetical protein [Alloalcanivorax mobilis]|uniref:hypothetical protein n=1 Tax=Alloalcanivorax mobilis TaxID=2019569 RepID=UPI000C791F3C|nr:hypothetical protein [Alloalcanivorax mobilis]